MSGGPTRRYSDARFLQPLATTDLYGSSSSLASDRLPSINSSAASSRHGSKSSLNDGDGDALRLKLPEIKLEDGTGAAFLRSRSLSRQGSPVPKSPVSFTLSAGIDSPGSDRRQSLAPSQRLNASRNSLGASYKSLASSNESLTRSPTPRSLGFRKIAPLVRGALESTSPPPPRGGLARLRQLFRSKALDRTDNRPVFYESCEELSSGVDTIDTDLDSSDSEKRQKSLPDVTDIERLARNEERKTLIKPNRRWMLFRNGLRGVASLTMAQTKEDCQIRCLNKDTTALTAHIAHTHDIPLMPSMETHVRTEGFGRHGGGRQRGRYFPTLNQQTDAAEISFIIQDYLFGAFEE